MVREKLNEFLKKYQSGKKFSAAEFVSAMEPEFAAEGYRETIPGKSRKNILIVRDDAAGDFVLFSGFLREVRRIYPKAHITLIVSTRSYELAQCCPYVDNLELNPASYDPEKFPEAFEFTINFVSERLLPRHFDLAFCGRLGIKSTSLLTAYISGARERIAFSQDRMRPDGKKLQTGWDSLLTLPVPFPTGNWHDAEMNFRILDYMLRLPVENRALEVWCLSQDEAFAKEQISALSSPRPPYAIIPGASVRSKEWPAEYYIEFLKMLIAKEPDATFVILGGPGEEAPGEAIAKALGSKRAINLAGRLNFRQSAAAIKQCAVYMGNDTGLLHIAAAMKRPILGFYCFPANIPRTPSSVPWRFAPYNTTSVALLPPEAKDGCKDNFRYGCSRNNERHCITGISPQLAIKGYEILRERIEKRITETLYLTGK